MRSQTIINLFKLANLKWKQKIWMIYRIVWWITRDGRPSLASAHHFFQLLEQFSDKQFVFATPFYLPFFSTPFTARHPHTYFVIIEFTTMPSRRNATLPVNCDRNFVNSTRTSHLPSMPIDWNRLAFKLGDNCVACANDV